MAVTRGRKVVMARVALIAGLTLGVSTAAGLAWACVPQPRLITVQPRASGPAGSEVTVASLGFDPGRAEVRWNAADGDLLASAEGPDFSVPVKIPEAPDGVYHVVVLARSPGGEIGNTASVSFQVTSSATASDSPAPRPPAGGGLTPSRSSISTGAVLLAGAAGALAGLCCFGALLALRRKRNGPSSGAPQVS